MKRPADSNFFLLELRQQLGRLPSCPDVLAIGYLKAIYHLGATYGLLELQAEMESAAAQIYLRLKKDDPIRVHAFISTMMSLPSLCALEWILELEATIATLKMPDISRKHLESLRRNVES